MSVSILDASAWREFRGKPANAGLNETTHLAKIADASGKLHDCFVKLLPMGGPALLCEALGWLLARKSDVSCQAFGAIVLVPVDELRKCAPLPSKFDAMALCPAWCSEIVAGKSVRQIHKMFYFIARKNCLRKDARKIAAFDQWSDLRDRNFGNVIQSRKGGYIAIDHESLLHDLLWVVTGCGFEERSLMVEAAKHCRPQISNDSRSTWPMPPTVMLRPVCTARRGQQAADGCVILRRRHNDQSDAIPNKDEQHASPLLGWQERCHPV